TISVPYNVSFTVVDPNDAANLFAGGFNLIDASADTVVGGLVEGQELEPGLYDFEGLAAGSGVPTRVEMELTGPVSTSVNLTTGPYLLTSETDGDYAGLNLTTGSYSIEYRPFDTNDVPGTPRTFNFTVAAPADPISVDAINISVDSASAVAMAGGESYASVNSLEFNVTTTGPVGSVSYELENTVSGAVTPGISDNAPYTLFSGGTTIASGSYTLTATPNYATDGSSNDGTPLTVSFSVVSNTRILFLDAYAASGTPLRDNIQNGDTITFTNAEALGGIAFEAIANNPEISGTGTQSVLFEFTATAGLTYTDTQLEFAPGYWSAAGNSLATAGLDFFAPGTYRLDVTAYSEDVQNAADAGDTLTITFVVEDA
ncbi:MAG: hypothetical protein AAFS10_12850, partial [Myxococcota bacterium]